MTRERAKQLLPVIAAYADGKAVQVRAAGSQIWDNISDDAVFGIETADYRVRPEPREWWLTVDNDWRAHIWDKEACADHNRRTGEKIIHVREVIE